MIPWIRSSEARTHNTRWRLCYGICHAELKQIDTFMKDHHRKCIGWLKPMEKIAAFLVCAS